MKAKLFGLLALAVVTLASTSMLAQYYGPGLSGIHSGTKKETHTTKNGNSTTETTTVKASILLSFGNGTRIWFNNTAVPSDFNFYNVTYEVTNGNMVARWYEAYQSHFVFSIMGYGCLAGQFSCGGYWWSLWVWNQEKLCWNLSNLGVDWLKVLDISIIAWHFTNGGTSLAPQC